MKVPVSEIVRAALETGMAELRVAMPGVIQSFDSKMQWADVQPCLSDTVVQDGEETTYTLPVVSNVPVQFPGGGGLSITFPVRKGDPCFLIFCDRSLDSWLDTGKVGAPIPLHHHQLTDAVCVLGVRSRADALRVFDTSRVTIGKDSGTTHQIALGDIVANVLSGIRTIFNAHTHTISGGATTAPLVPLPDIPDVKSTVLQTRE